MTGGMRLLLERIEFWQNDIEWRAHWNKLGHKSGHTKLVSPQETLLFDVLNSIDIRSLARNKPLLTQIKKALDEIHINQRTIS